MVAIIDGSFYRSRPLVELYRQAGSQAGHAPEDLKVGVHALGFVADTPEDARDLFFPGWHHMFSKVGRERGWPAPTREQFDHASSPAGAYLIGDPDTVFERVQAMDAALGGVSRVTFQMTSVMLEPDAMQRSIELLGSEVAARLRRTVAP